jgi:hypothetical protein
MNRREFLRAGFQAAAGLAVLSICPVAALADKKAPPFKFTEDITYHRDRAAWFYVAQARICGVDYYVGEYMDNKTEESIKNARITANYAFKRRAKKVAFG